MCGIAGIVDKSNLSIAESQIKQMTRLVAHRGPDDEGYYLGSNFALGHRRLAIIDLSQGAHQPMEYLGKYIIIYNGEVYNYIELRLELEKEGFPFKSSSDTEVILAAYAKWGFDCVKRFNGMWAFALYDREKEILFCSRDRFGVKPFYYCEVADQFVFGSEIKQLLAFSPVRYANARVLMDYLVLGFEDHTNETFFEGIYKLEQSHNLIYDLKSHKFRISRYYDINTDEKLQWLSDEASSRLLREALQSAVAIRLRSDVRVGTCLSGGLDSSSIAAVASEIYHKEGSRRFSAIHAKSTETRTDESHFAKECATFLGLDLYIVEPALKDLLNCIDDVFHTIEEPFGSISILMQFFVMRKAKELGCTVMLDGQGGDETLIGYERYYPAYLLSLTPLSFLREFIGASANSKLSLGTLLAYILYFRFARIRKLRLMWKYRFLKRKYVKRASFDSLKEAAQSYFSLVELQKSEISRFQLAHLLKYEDRNSMRHSIEARLPFLDFKLLEIALSLNSRVKIKNGWTKYALRKAMENRLPESVIWRRNKLGFEGPAQELLSHIRDHYLQKEIDDSPILSEIIDRSKAGLLSAAATDNQVSWKLFNIARWERAFNVRLRSIEDAEG